jgi:hypothetical protein
MGPGVYTSVQSIDSWRWCGSPQGGWDKSEVRSNPLYLALTELVPAAPPNQSMYVNPQNESVILRFLFAFPSSDGSNQPSPMPSTDAIALQRVNTSSCTPQPPLSPDQQLMSLLSLTVCE